MRRIISCVETLPVSAAECERGMGFSRMNLVCDELRSTITMQHLSALMFVSLVGRPLYGNLSHMYGLGWLQGDVGAAATDCPSRTDQEAIADPARQFAWNVL